jgi:hypothetical protein
MGGVSQSGRRERGEYGPSGLARCKDAESGVRVGQLGRYQQFYDIAPLSLSIIALLHFWTSSINATLREGRETRITAKQCCNLTEMYSEHKYSNTTKNHLFRHPTDGRSASGKLPGSFAPMGPSSR